MKQLVAIFAFLLVVETAAVIYLWNRPGRGVPVLVEPSDTGVSNPKKQPSSTKSAPTDLEPIFRETLRSKPESIASLIPRAPLMGGEWRAVESRAEFVPPNFARIYYEDGHIAGLLVVVMDDPARPETWKTLHDDPDPE